MVREENIDPLNVELLSALAKREGAMTMIHAENADCIAWLTETLESAGKTEPQYHSDSRPQVVEREAAHRAISLAELVDVPALIVHVSGAETIDTIRTAQGRGINIFAETCPQYLILNEEVFKGENGHLFATCPQVKSEKDGQRLWLGLADGSISTVGTDTCTFNTEQKAMWQGDFTKIPFGLPGTELMVPLLYNDGVKAGKISLRKMVEVGSTNPAKVYGLYPQKGSLRAGSDADIVIFDSDKEVVVDYKNMETNCDWNPFQGKHLKGYPHLTLVRGKVVGKEGKCIGEKGHGKFVKRGTSGNYV